jgi:hypothetical protein
MEGQSQPGYILFLTDGLPTVGETREMVIAKDCADGNKAKARLFAFGVGYDVNSRLLDRLSGSNGGTTEYVRPTEDIEEHVSRFYSRLTSPALSGIQIEFSKGEAHQLYPASIPDLFEGGQLVVVGRYRQAGEATLRLTGKTGAGPYRKDYPVKLAEADGVSPYRFTERLWAARRIGYLIDQIDLSGRNKELMDELVRLSSKYGILTPYTSFLADEGVSLRAQEQNVARAAELASSLDQVSGQGVQAQRAFKAGMMAQTVLSAPAASPVPSVDGKAVQVYSVRQVGEKTFYLKDGRWTDSSLAKDVGSRAVEIEQFSEDYFTLADAMGPEFNQYLVFKEPVTVRWEGKIYRIKPAGE